MMEREMDTECIAQALDGLSEVQRRRILMFAEWNSVRELAVSEVMEGENVHGKSEVTAYRKC